MSQNSSPIRRATAADVGPAAETLAAAFLDYPWTRWVIPEDDYAARLLELQRIYVQHATDHGITLVAADRAGVVALLPPDAPAPSDETLGRIVELHGDRISRLGGEDAPGDASEAGQSGEAGDAGHAGHAGHAGQAGQAGHAGGAGQSSEAGPASQTSQASDAGQSGEAGEASEASQAAAWRLETLGVHPDARGRGLGGDLIAAALQAARAHGAAAVALETSDPRNVALYERHSFEIRKHQTAEDGPETWDMVAHQIPEHSAE